MSDKILHRMEEKLDLTLERLAVIETKFDSHKEPCRVRFENIEKCREKNIATSHWVIGIILAIVIALSGWVYRG